MEKSLVEYSRPPLIETVYSVQFEPLGGSSSLLAQFWQVVKDEFPSMEDQPALANVIEPEFLTPQFQPLRIQFDQNSRLFMTSANKSFVLQLQRDRFVLNWRRVSPQMEYPRFGGIYPRFEVLLDKLKKFTETQGLGQVVQNQFELTYVNIVDQKNGLERVTMNGLFVDHLRSATGEDRFLPLPENLNWQSSFPLPDRQGRLHISAATAYMVQNLEQGPVMRVDLTARGIGKDRSDSGRRDWFNLAHRWIVLGFADIMSLDVQKECWGRT